MIPEMVVGQAGGEGRSFEGHVGSRYPSTALLKVVLESLREMFVISQPEFTMYGS